MESSPNGGNKHGDKPVPSGGRGKKPREEGCKIPIFTGLVFLKRKGRERAGGE